MRHRIIEEGEYFSLIELDSELLIVFSDFFTQENAIVFTVGHPMTDWSKSMLLSEARRTVKLMNSVPL